MNKELTKIEKALLYAIIDENKNKYAFLLEQFNHLYVKDREFTGVGIYTNFDYYKKTEFPDVDVIISSNKTLRIIGFENAVTFVLDVTAGKVNFLEIVSNGNDVFMPDKFDYEFELI